MFFMNWKWNFNELELTKTLHMIKYDVGVILSDVVNVYSNNYVSKGTSSVRLLGTFWYIWVWFLKNSLYICVLVLCSKIYIGIMQTN